LSIAFRWAISGIVGILVFNFAMGLGLTTTDVAGSSLIGFYMGVSLWPIPALAQHVLLSKRFVTIQKGQVAP
jgi:hypothetical protein